MAGFWTAPEGLRVDHDGTWTVGGLKVRHPPSLRELKSRLRFSDEGAFLVDGTARLPVEIDGPAYEVQSLRLDEARGQACAVLDDGSEESPTEFAVEASSGRLLCTVREGRARAVLSRAAHQCLVDHVVEEKDGRFSLAIGPRRLTLQG